MKPAKKATHHTKAAAKKHTPPPTPKAKATRSTKMAEPTEDPNEVPSGNEEETPPVDREEVEKSEAEELIRHTGKPVGPADPVSGLVPHATTMLGMPPDLNPPTGNVPNPDKGVTPPPGQPYTTAYDDPPADPPPPDAPRSYPVAGGPSGPVVVTGLKTAQDVADDIAGVSQEERESRLPTDGNASTNAKTVPPADRLKASKHRSEWDSNTPPPADPNAEPLPPEGSGEVQ